MPCKFIDLTNLQCLGLPNFLPDPHVRRRGLPRQHQDSVRFHVIQVLLRMFTSHLIANAHPDHQVTIAHHGLVVMGGDSCSEGCGFESQHHILEGHFSHIFVLQIVMFVRKD